jgi:asparagine synthase (glutamine-hydrolysing)
LAGFLLSARRDNREDLRAILTRMAMLQDHRGPDGIGVWSDGLAGLSLARLAIMDPTDTALMPQVSEDGGTVAAFNGEAYNFAELREELEAKGHAFASDGDGEVVLNGYREWGCALFRRLKGMFAIAIWDASSRRMVLARDPVGKKPMAYARVGREVVFASEPKAIFAWPGAYREPNLAAIHRYLAIGYVPGTETAFTGVARVPAGHWMEIAPGGRTRLVPFDALPPPEDARERPESELREELAARLDAAVRRRLRADAPMGALISGGLDSSVVAALAVRAGATELSTFSVGFREAAFDERGPARRLAEYLGLPHTQALVAPDDVDRVADLAWHFGDPFADPSALPTYLVSRLARRSVKVVLTGDGGDEAFLGYERYRRIRERGFYDRNPQRTGPWPPRFAQDYERWFGGFTALDRTDLYGPRMTPLLADTTEPLLERAFGAAPTPVAAAAWADLHGYLRDGVLVKLDIAAMAHGLEPRSPLLDREVLGFAATVPDHQKVRFSQPKWLLRAAVRGLLPDPILDRPKQGFAIPLDAWIRGPLFERFRETLLSDRAIGRALFRRETVERLLDEHRGRRARHHLRLWILFMLEWWFRVWIDCDPTTRVPMPSNG